MRLQTNHGKLTLTLKPAWAPKHVINTMYLSMLGYYDNTIMHRVIPGFMVGSFARTQYLYI